MTSHKHDRKELLSLLEAAKPGLADKELVQQTTSFIFSNEKLITFNDEISVVTDSPFGSDVEGAVPAKECMEMLARFNDKKVTVYSNESELRIEGKNKKIGIRLQQEIQAPITEVLEFENQDVEWGALPNNFNEIIDFVRFSVSTNTNKPLFNCVHFDKDIVESCDNYRMTRYFLEMPHFEEGFLIHYQNVRALLNYPRLEYYCLDDNWAHFLDENGLRISCRYRDDSFPDVSALMFEDGVPLTFPEGFREALSRSKVMVDTSHIDYEKVDVTLDGNQIILESKNDSGWFKETLEHDHLPDIDITFTINPRFLDQVVKKMGRAYFREDVDRIAFHGDEFAHIIALFYVGNKKQKAEGKTSKKGKKKKKS